jgi:hypothetical protein
VVGLLVGLIAGVAVMRMRKGGASPPAAPPAAWSGPTESAPSTGTEMPPDEGTGGPA